MVTYLKTFLNREVQGLHQAAYILGAFAIMSQVFALLRDRLLAGTFGAGIELDFYYAAFRLPDMLFVILSTLVSVSVLVPLIIRKRGKKGQKRFFDSLFTTACIAMVVLYGVFYWITPYFLKLIVPELYALDSVKLIMLTRIMLLQPILLALSSFLGSFAQAHKKFVIYATSPIVYNLGIILGVLILYPVYGLVGLAGGVVLGALLHMVILIPTVCSEYSPSLARIYPKEVWKVFKTAVPRTFTMISNQIVLILMTFFAGLLATGSIAIFSLAYALQSVPLSIIGVSYSLAAFPTLAVLFKEEKRQEFYDLISRAIRHVFFWSIPVVVCFVVLRAQIVRVILGSGNFDWNETILVAAALALFTLSLIAQSASLVLIRAFYAMGRTYYPFIVTLVSVMSMGLLLFVVLIPDISTNPTILYIETLLKVDMVASSLVLLLPIIFSIGQWIQFFLLLIGIGGLKYIFTQPFFKSIGQSFLSASLMAVVMYLGLDFLSGVFDLNTFVGIFFQGLIAGVSGLLVGFAFLLIIGNHEVAVAIATLSSKYKRKPVVLQPEVQEEL